MRSRHRLSTTSITVALVAMFGGGATQLMLPASMCMPRAQFAIRRTRTMVLGPGYLEFVGRQAGSAPGFRYSQAMKTSNIVWDEKSLDAFITAPQKALPGNVMPFAGLPYSQQRTDLIAYLETLK